MKRTQVTLVNKLGLHARAAARLVHLAKTFASDVRLGRNGELKDAKSIMSVLLLAAPVGAVLDLQADGEDETSALAAIRQLIADRFGEAE